MDMAVDVVSLQCNGSGNQADIRQPYLVIYLTTPTRTNVDAYFVLSLGAKVNNNKCLARQFGL